MNGKNVALAVGEAVSLTVVAYSLGKLITYGSDSAKALDSFIYERRLMLSSTDQKEKLEHARKAYAHTFNMGIFDNLLWKKQIKEIKNIVG